MWKRIWHQCAQHETTGHVIEPADAIQCSSPRKRGFAPFIALPMAAAAVLLVRSGIETRGRGLEDIQDAFAPSPGEAHGG